MADVLWRTVQQILETLIRTETGVSRWIRNVGKVQPYWTERCLITDSETRSLHRVICILDALLRIAKRQVTERGVNVAHVLKKDPSDIGTK